VLILSTISPFLQQFTLPHSRGDRLGRFFEVFAVAALSSSFQFGFKVYLSRIRQHHRRPYS
jgi:hypothetical protein